MTTTRAGDIAGAAAQWLAVLFGLFLLRGTTSWWVTLVAIPLIVAAAIGLHIAVAVGIDLWIWRRNRDHRV
jgi:hypothetical protein